MFVEAVEVLACLVVVVERREGVVAGRRVRVLSSGSSTDSRPRVANARQASM